jgi:hypothetical protein
VLNDQNRQLARFMRNQIGLIDQCATDRARGSTSAIAYFVHHVNHML